MPNAQTMAAPVGRSNAKSGERRGAGDDAGDPADRELLAEVIREHDADRGRNDEQRKHQQDAGDRDR